MFEPTGKNAEILSAFPFLWKVGLAGVIFFHVWVLGNVILSGWLRDLNAIFLWLAVLCLIFILCSVFWMAVQPNRSVAVLSPWTILKDKFSSRRPNG
jgi:hypothetical protein